MGPKDVHIGLVDQDGANGNVARTNASLMNYIKFRETWGRKDPDNMVDWSHDVAPGLGATVLKPLFDNGKRVLSWPTQKHSTLDAILGNNLPPEHRALFDMLFMNNIEEQNRDLTTGYGGRAHVGAAALVAWLLEDDNELVDSLTTLMEDAGRKEVKIFVVGSAYGGTGAAGFPTLARALDRIRRSSTFRNAGNVTLGGLLMLPYFSFDNPDEDTPGVVTADELIPKSRLALEYYETLFSHEKIFDRFYTLGWGELFRLGYHNYGGAEQANPSLPPELLASTAIIDFFTSDLEPRDAADPVPVVLSARQDKAIRWRDFPLENMDNQFGQLLRFAIYWRYIVEPLLHQKQNWLGGPANWAQKLAGDVKSLESEDYLNSLRQFIDDILLWAATVEHMAGRDYTGTDYWKGGPWDLTRILDQRNSGPDAPKTHPVKVLTEVTREDLTLDAIDHLTRNDKGEFYPQAVAGRMHLELTRGGRNVGGEHRGLGRTYAAVYAASAAKG